MACAQTGSLLDHFSVLRDPRQGGKVLYPLPEILLLVLCATLAGANDFVAVRLWGEQALPFLRRFLPYDDGLPSHDTLSDVMNALDPELFKECFLGWVETLRSSPTEADGPEIIAVVLRQAQDEGQDGLVLRPRITPQEFIPRRCAERAHAGQEPKTPDFDPPLDQALGQPSVPTATN